MIESDILDFKKNLIGLEFSDILRKGKWLLFEIGDYYLCSHLRMEGKYFIKNHDEEINKHEHVEFILDNDTSFRYHDVRKFGKMHLIDKDKVYDVEPLSEMGKEFYDDSLTKEYLYDAIELHPEYLEWTTTMHLK